MGVLDDAIREHLELKRRRGADEDDLARLEAEALGPVVRHPAAVDLPVDHPPESEPELYEDRGEGDPEPAHPEADPEPEPRDEEAPPAFDEPEPRDEGHDRASSQETAQFSPEDVADALGRAPREGPARPRAAPTPKDPGEEHDELEDTPEFLQEAPEHDRLWFEQKPPKDFEF